MDCCNEFRTRLVTLLSGSPTPPDWAALSWHEHLHTCADCRALLEAEEALEVLLATLPELRLPRALCERVLSRLEVERAPTDLDSMLDLVSETPPRELADNVLKGLRDTRRIEREERALDGLLDRLPEPAVPAGLADRVLDGLERDRGSRRQLRPVSTGPTGPRRARWAVAAGVLFAAAFGLWRSTQAPDEDPGVDPRVDLAQATDERPTAAGGETPRVALAPVEPPNGIGDEPTEELLASLDMLESWDLLMDDDVDLVLASLDTFDELVLYLDDEELGG